MTEPSGEFTLFVRDGDELIGSFAPEYAAVLRELVRQSSDVLDQPVDRDDPGLARLFPDVYPDSQADSAELRRLTESDLRADKLASARLILDTLPADGGEVRLDDEAASVWLRGLNDIRLLLGSRLEVDADTDLAEELDAEIRRDPSSPRAAQLLAYVVAGEVQDALLVALTGWRY